MTDGLTNGAECIVENIDYRVENSTRPSIIWVFPYETNRSAADLQQICFGKNRSSAD